MGRRQTEEKSKPADTPLAKAAGVVTLVTGLEWVDRILHNFGKYLPSLNRPVWTEQLDVLLKISVLVMLFHGISWVLLERLILHKNYTTGETPKGWRAVVMSMSLTLPVLIVPAIYQHYVTKSLLFPNHLRGAIAALAGGAIAYNLLFGIEIRKRSLFAGVRGLILGSFHQWSWWGETLATLAYSFILITFIAIPYRLLVLPHSYVYADLVWAALASGLIFFGLSTYILLWYPDSLNTETYYGKLRGLFAGIFTVLGTCTALYGL